MIKKTVILAAMLLTVSVAPPVAASSLSNAYHCTCDKLSNHKGKVGLAVGAIGTTLITKAFSTEIDLYVKPLFKSVFKKVGRWFKRVFIGNKTAS